MLPVNKILEGRVLITLRIDGWDDKLTGKNLQFSVLEDLICKAWDQYAEAGLHVTQAAPSDKLAELAHLIMNAVQFAGVTRPVLSLSQGVIQRTEGRAWNAEVGSSNLSTLTNQVPAGVTRPVPQTGG
jgi:hypothetical protein